MPTVGSSLHHKQLITLNGEAGATEVQAALEALPGIKPRVVHDDGGESVNTNVVAMIMARFAVSLR